MKKLSSEAKTGILVTATIALLIWGFNVLKGRDLFRPGREYYATYDKIDGLVKNSPVLFNGLKVGQVKDVYFLNGRIVVLFSVVEDEITVPNDSKATIISADFLGTKAVNLELGISKTDAPDGDTLSSSLEEGLTDAVKKEIAPLKNKIEGLILSIDSVAVIVQEILNKDARVSLTSSFESIKRALNTFENTALKIDKLVENEGGKIGVILSKVEVITSAIAKNNDKITAAMNNIANITDSLSKSNLVTTINRTNKTLEETSILLEKINKGEGSMGLLINDKKLYNNLDSTTASLNNLIQDMEKNPWRYFSLYSKKKRTKKPKK
jgi:phospholipid/cholesterol/gamma-HCH transport system substrate-binding protein